jgi:hypothetical protein
MHCRATKFIGRPQHLDRWRWKPRQDLNNLAA